MPFSAHADVALVDSSGLQYIVDTDTNVSGDLLEASYTTAVTATTLYGGTTTITLDDMVDHYCSMGVNGALCANNGVATLEDDGREIVTNAQQIGNLSFYRKIFVPETHEFCRWLNVITNTGTVAEDVLVNFQGDMGAGLNTCVFYTSLAYKGAMPSALDTWIVTGGQPTDVRCGHVFQGPDASVKPTYLALQQEDAMFWRYRFWLNPGETAILMNFVTGQPDVEDALARVKEIVALQGAALQGMTDAEKEQVINFQLTAPAAVQCAGTTAAKNAPISEAWGDMAVLGAALLVSFALGRRRPKQ